MAQSDMTKTQTVTIGAGASLSGASTKWPGYKLIGLMTASTWDAAKITFQGSVDGTTYANLYDKTAEYEIAAVTGAACVALDVTAFMPWDYIKVRSGTAAAPTNQVDATVVTLVFAPVV
jgi:hypothetical protein